MSIARKLCTAVLMFALIAPYGAMSPTPASAAAPNIAGKVAYTVTLLHGEKATVYLNGSVAVASSTSKSHPNATFRTQLPLAVGGDVDPATLRGRSPAEVMQLLRLPSPQQASVDLNEMLMRGSGFFVPHSVIVAYRPGTTGSQDVMTVSQQVLKPWRAVPNRKTMTATPTGVPQYTNDYNTNKLLASLGTDHVSRLFRGVPKAHLEAMTSGVRMPNGGAPLDLGNVYLLHITNSSDRAAVQALVKLPTVAFAEPELRVSPMRVSAVPVPTKALLHAQRQARAMSALSQAPHVSFSLLSRPAAAYTLRSASDRSTASAVSAAGGFSLNRAAASRTLRGNRQTDSGTAAPPTADLPTNYDVTASGQSFLNATGVDAVAAYDEIERTFHQLPGQGEIITNVSLGDLDDASAASNPNDPCQGWVQEYGPTTIMQGGQRYIQWPTMNPIPTYTADQRGNVNGQGEVCGEDPGLGEVGLDFSVMAPLPHNLAQSPGVGLTDLLGIAPGAQYRLVVPGDAQATNADLAGAFLGAALQTPSPNVITGSLGFGWDSYGFPGRYLEEDPLIESVIASIVSNYHIVVCISANDGVRLYTSAPVGPSGGSAPTNIGMAGNLTNDADVSLSTTPSLVLDSGSIDVGATTLDDIAADPPDGANDQTAQQTYAETRWDGGQDFSSGFGSRVDVAAPGDNILSFDRAMGPNAPPGRVQLVLDGGTSASAPMTAAASAVVLQVARLTGHPMTPPQVRALLESTGNPIPNVPQADVPLTMGTQINLRKAVESLLQQAGQTGTPTVARVAVAQRQSAQFNLNSFDTTFLTDTNPASIDLEDGYNLGGLCSLMGAALASGSCANGTGENSFAPITIAPDWEFVPSNTQYSLTVNGKPTVLATSPWARLYPANILQAAGLTLKSSGSRTVQLTYRARIPGATAFLPSKVIAVSFSLTFGPSTGTEVGMPSVQVPAVVTGSTIPVTYDLTHTIGDTAPRLIVSPPGMFSLAGWSEAGLFPQWSTKLAPGSKGTVNVPVSALDGGGIYGVFINDEQDSQGFVGGVMESDAAFTRVQPPSTTVTRPPAPTLSTAADPGAFHMLEFPYNGQFQLTYNVSNVPNATGAVLEISAPEMTAEGRWFDFNNPNGTERDADVYNTGSIYYQQLPGAHGSVTLSASQLGLLPTYYYQVRVLPTGSGQVIGEASDVSTITEDGIVSPDGYQFYSFGGYGFNSHGTDGLLGSAFGDIYEIDQTTDTATTLVAAPTNLSAYYLKGPGIFGQHDLGLITLYDDNGSQPTDSWDFLNPAAAGAITGHWDIPSSYQVGGTAGFFNDSDAISPNDQTSEVVQLAWNTAGTHTLLYTSDLSQDTFGSLFDLGPGLLFNVGIDPALNVAVGVGDNLIDRIDLSTGAVTPLSVGRCNHISGVQVDSVRHVAAVICSDSNGVPILHIINLTTNNSLDVAVGAYFSPDFVGIDKSSGKIILALIGSSPTASQQALYNQLASWDAFGMFAGGDQNHVGEIEEYDEQGNFLKGMNAFNDEALTNWWTGQDDLQIANGKIYYPGLLRQQIGILSE